MNFAKRRKKNPVEEGFQEQLTRDDWLEWRALGLGGSDAAVALRVHPYTCPLDLYLDKVKQKRKQVDNNATRWGHTLEPLVIDMTQKRHPDECERVFELPLMVDPDFPQLRATMDAGCSGSLGPGIIEAKTALSFHGRLMFDGGLPAHYRAQCLHYLLVSRRKFAILGALTEGYGERFFTIKPDLDELEDLESKELELWDRMWSHDVMWLLEGSEKTAKALEKLYGHDVERPEPVDSRGSEEVNRALESYYTAKQAEKENKEQKTQAENILKATIGEAEEMICDHALVKWSRTKRGRRFTVKES